MKLSKAILIVLTSLAITAAISTCLSLGCLTLFGTSFWYMFLAFFASQIGGYWYFIQYKESETIQKNVLEYNNKPFKRYIVPLKCSHCSHVNEIATDLQQSEFQCTNCLKYNGVHVNFMCAAITEPISMNEPTL